MALPGAFFNEPTKEEVLRQSHKSFERSLMGEPVGDVRSYRVYLLSREDHIIKSIEITSANDEDARQQAKCHAGQYAVELWDRARKLEHFPSKS